MLLDILLCHLRRQRHSVADRRRRRTTSGPQGIWTGTLRIAGFAVFVISLVVVVVVVVVVTIVVVAAVVAHVAAVCLLSCRAG